MTPVARCLHSYRGRLSSLCLAVAFVVAPALHAQQSAAGETTSTSPPANSLVQNKPSLPSEPPQQDLAFEGLDSFGNYRIFASTENVHLYAGGVEYDRHSWGSFIGARMDYVGEVQFLLMNEPATTDLWGDTVGPGRKTLPGVGVLPIGLRMVWLDGRFIKPYFTVKGGMNAFTQKALTKASSYEAFNLQEAVGLLVRVAPRYDVRLGFFGDYHFSNGFMVPANPGLDVMNATIGLSYHLGRQRSQ